MDKRPCDLCGTPIPSGAAACPSCGHAAPVESSGLTADVEHLKLLSIFHYVLAGVTAIFSSFFVIHLAIGIGMLVGADSGSWGGQNHGHPPPAFMGWIFAIFGGAAVLMGWTFAVFLVVAGRSLARRRRLLLCMIVAGLSCLMMPLGTVLGVFTLVVLSRPSVKALFAASQ